MRQTFWIAAGSALALAACNDPAPAGSGEPAAPSASQAGVEMAEAVFHAEGAWVRNPPPGRDVTAGFLTLSAEGGPGRLVDARTSAAARMEIHTMAMEGDVMRMRRVEGFDIPEGGAITLAPGGDHLMLFDIDRSAFEAGEITIDLVFEDGQTLSQAFTVLDAAPVNDNG
ncbi:copper chaperone PCu(A)C [Alkalicaulis satelles]|uniref:Copper chaperone PCu(A)C n=1 Tax=Alkalicaulis satelles TaxID=2609175 RepID=A0A5M6ZGI0_9PROT|nr:copper chaperone PCu(A)C [Alkalicaulis satelles]KAA5803400.1 copper chaperone PCu(A)C [Alkalicaulis satelles]